MGTPKKVVETDRCFICSKVVAKKEKLYIFGKSSIDFCEIVKSALNVNVRNFSASEQLFICRAECYQRLTKFKRALDNLNKAKSELEEVYKATVHRTKRLCKDDAEEDAANEVDKHVEQSTRGKVAKVLHFSEATTCTSSPRASPDALSDGQRCVLDEPFCFLSPIQSNGGELLKRAFINTIARSPNVVTSTPRKILRNCEQDNSQTSNVTLSISYPSKNVNKSLHGSYQHNGKALAHGIPSRVANAAMNCQPVRKHIVEKTLGILKKEITGLCSKNNPSLLRKSSKEGLTDFDLQHVCEEWKVRAPLFYSFLMTSATNKRTKASSWFGSVAVAGSVLLKQRSKKMDATSSLLGIMMKTKSIEVCSKSDKLLLVRLVNAFVLYPFMFTRLRKLVTHVVPLLTHNYYLMAIS